MSLKVCVYDSNWTLNDVIKAFHEKGVKRKINFKKLKILPSDYCGASVTFEYDSHEDGVDEWGDEIW
jgi:hypothetical protein